MENKENIYAKIGFENYHVSCIIGDLPRERLQPQDLYIDLYVEADVKDCAKSDEVTDTVDYVRLAEICTQTSEKKFKMLETYAYNVLQTMISEFSIRSGWIKVKKNNAFQESCNATVELLIHI